jgi:hypothetical protein
MSADQRSNHYKCLRNITKQTFVTIQTYTFLDTAKLEMVLT